MFWKADTIVAATKAALEALNIPIAKITGLGSDGAAVMMGIRTGVGKACKMRNTFF